MRRPVVVVEAWLVRVVMLVGRVVVLMLMRVRVLMVMVRDKRGGRRSGARRANCYLTLLAFARTCVPETLGKGVIVNLKLGYTLILISCNCNKFCLFKYISSKCSPG